MIRDYIGVYPYKWVGWMENPAAAGKGTAGGPASYRAFFDGNTRYAKINYEPGGPYREVEGRILTNGELISGRIRFEDGSLYEGFLYNSKRFGPGRYTAANGNKTEGIWSLDSLMTPMKIELADVVFAPPSGPADLTTREYTFAGMSNLVDHSYFKTSNGWLYAYEENTIYFGKAEGGSLTGPGIMITLYDNPHGDFTTEWYTYRTGIFAQGQLAKGIRVKDYMNAAGAWNGPKPAVYARNKTMIVQGDFNGGKLVAACGKILTLNFKGEPVRLLEGFVSQGYEKEVAHGWVYVNDWSGKRSGANLELMYNDRDFFDLDPNNASWVQQAYAIATEPNNCFSSIATQSVSLLPSMKARHDSVVAASEKREADLAAFKAAWAAREKACLDEATKQPYDIGGLYRVAGNNAHVGYVLITGSFSCVSKSFPVFVKGWVASSELNRAYATGASYVLAKDLAASTKVEGKHTICNKCYGSGSVSGTAYNAVGGNSGYTDLGNGWKVKNPETYWKSEYNASCVKCGGVGFLAK